METAVPWPLQASNHSLRWPGERGIELACLVLRWLPEGTSGTIIEALPAHRKRILLKLLHGSLPEMIAFAYQALNKYYAALCQADSKLSASSRAVEVAAA